MAGIGGRPKGGPAVTERAPLVIGADGKHSMVAAAVGAPSYRARPPLSMGFYTYWADAPVSGGELYGRPGCALGAWPTNDGLVMTYLAWPAARFDEFRRDVEGNFLRTLDDVGLGERIRAGRRAERAVPLREFMAPREMVRLVGVRGFAKLVLGQARRGRPAAGQAELVAA